MKVTAGDLLVIITALQNGMGTRGVDSIVATRLIDNIKKLQVGELQLINR